LKSLKVLGNIRSEAVNFFFAKLGKKSFIENGSYTRLEFFFWPDEKLCSQKLFFCKIDFFFEKKMTGPESLCFASMIF